MKKLTMISFLVLSILSCNEKSKTLTIEINNETKERLDIDRSKDFPKDIAAVFKAHGGIRNFNKMNTLIFELVKPQGNEKHTTDLKTRHARIETDKFTLGFDGAQAWLEQDSAYFKGNPRFYHNLMFYFYAMPFVLGDDGIVFEKTEDLKVGDQSYPGYRISYNEGIGDSPKDNYFLYFDPNSYQMKFLGYTVTFFSKETSAKISLIEYSDWNDVNGLLLPKTLKWRNYENGIVGDIKSERNFVNTVVSTEKLSDSLFIKPKSTEK